MMKVAIAGTGGLAQYIAHHIETGTYHQFILLSRSVGALPVSHSPACTCSLT